MKIVNGINLLKPSMCADTKHHAYLGCWDLGFVFHFMNTPEITKKHI